jgi:formyl-CoA transferase
MAGDSRFATNAAQVKHRAALVEELEPRFPEYASAHRVTLISDASIPAGPINTLPDSCDPHVAARNMVVDVAHPTAGQVRLLAPPYKLDWTPASVDRHPPLLGEHTEEVLREHLGLDTRALTELGSGVV